MNVSHDEIRQLEQWLESNLSQIVNHAERTAHVLQGTGGAPTGAQARAIIRFAAQAVSGEAPTPQPLTTQQAATWKALLPLLVEHAQMVLKAIPPSEAHATMTKLEAAAFLGFSLRKLEKHMERRDLTYEKFGAGHSATVRFNQSDLVAFKLKRTVTTRKKTVGQAGS